MKNEKTLDELINGLEKLNEYLKSKIKEAQDEEGQSQENKELEIMKEYLIKYNYGTAEFLGTMTYSEIYATYFSVKNQIQKGDWTGATDGDR